MPAGHERLRFWASSERSRIHRILTKLKLLPRSAQHPYTSFSMNKAIAAPLAVVCAWPALAEAPSLWRDPAQGCTYIVTPQGGVTLRYRRDGLPDCAEARTAPGFGSSVSAPVLDPRPQVAITSRAPRAANPATPVRGSISFSCQGNEADAAGDAPGMVRVRVEPEKRVIMVDAGEGLPQRYTLDSAGDIWFNGRNEQDPRLGIILSPSSGTMWLDTASGEPQHQVVARAQSFRCRSEGTMY